jgi:hypothetical protein
MKRWLTVILLLVLGGVSFFWWRDRVALERVRAELVRVSSLPDVPEKTVPEPVVVTEVPTWAARESSPLQVQTVAVCEVQSPPMTEALASAIDRFDVAMDREFNRLEAREQTSTDAAEITTIALIKEKLSNLDELYRRADATTDPAERAAIRADMQAEMGAIIGLSRRDRNERIGKLAADMGYTDPQAILRVVEEIDRIYQDTHLDWAKLFNRAPPE